MRSPENQKLIGQALKSLQELSGDVASIAYTAGKVETYQNSKRGQRRF